MSQGQVAPSESTNAEESSTSHASTLTSGVDRYSPSYQIKIPKDVNSIRLAMEQHGMVQESFTVDKYPEFKNKVLGIINDERLSTMKKKQVSKFTKLHRDVEMLNERTFMESLLPLIVKRKYTGKKDLEDGELAKLNEMLENVEGPAREALEKEYIHTTKEWIDDGLRVTMDAEFRNTLLPNKYFELGFQNGLARVLAKKEGMKNPKPDYAYGIRPDYFTRPTEVVIAPETLATLGIAPNLYHTFFLIEGKSENGSMGDARNQACRGGATLVNAGRMLRDMVGFEDTEGPDESTMVFSATMTPGHMQIWVHWAEVAKDKTVLFHMNKFASKLFDDEEHVISLRRILHNILQWGCVSRRADHIVFHEKLCEYQKQKTADLFRNATESPIKRTPGRPNKRQMRDDGSPRSRS